MSKARGIPGSCKRRRLNFTGKSHLPSDHAHLSYLARGAATLFESVELAALFFAAVLDLFSADGVEMLFVSGGP
jgi:hypothetical protein